MHEDTIITAALGEPADRAGVLQVRRAERIGEHDGRRWLITAHYRVERIETLARSDDIEALAAMLQAMRPTGERPKHRTLLVVDVTRSGRAVLDYLRKFRLQPVPVLMVDKAPREGGWGTVHVSLADVASRVNLALSEDRLMLDPKLEGLTELVAQLGEAGNERKAAAGREQPRRDELRRGLELAVYWGDKRVANRTDQPMPPFKLDLDEMTRPPTFDQVVKHYGR